MNEPDIPRISALLSRVVLNGAEIWELREQTQLLLAELEITHLALAELKRVNKERTDGIMADLGFPSIRKDSK